MVLDARALTSEEQDAAKILAEYFGSELTAKLDAPSIVDWAQARYLIPETGRPIKLVPIQKTFLRFALEHPTLAFTTILYSTIKKSGKTAISGLVGRYLTEFSGPKSEVYFLANDKEQAKDRAHESAKTSIELTTGWNRQKRELPGQWRIIEKEAQHLPTGSFMRAIASDYEGAAGGNPTATLWTELWGMTTERMKRLWDEMTPVPTRKRSIRYVETYAGFEDESEVLWNLFQTAVFQARKVTREELTATLGPDAWPYADEPPFYVNEAARSFAYYDTGMAARRMPWQRGPEADAYYKEQETTLRPEAFKRLHLNLWVSSVQEFIPEVWYTRQQTEFSHAPDIAYLRENNLPVPQGSTYDESTPVVMSADASISGDCTTLVGVSRTKMLARDSEGALELPLRWTYSAKHTTIRFAYVWFPPPHGTIDYAAVEAQIRELCKNYNIVQLPYDMYQLHDMMQRLTRDGVVWAKSFSQASDREVADADLYACIRDRRVHHNNEIDVQFIRNAKAYVAGNANKTNKTERLRIVKSGQDKPVDPVVAWSMANYECLRLNLG